MDYAQQQRDPGRHLLGIAFVVVFHIVLVYALMNGLARKAIDVLKQPLEVNLIEEIKQPPPPPPPPPKIVKVTPPPAVIPPPPVYVPPPEVRVEAPPPQVETVVTTTVPPPVVEVTPPPAPVVKVEPPAIVSVGVACPNHIEVRSNTPFPEQAIRQGLSGEVLVEFAVNPQGVVHNITVVKSSNRIFNNAATTAVGKLNCVGQEQSVRVRVPFVFKLEG